MNIFDEVNENIFRPLTGINKRKYADIIAIIWDRCKRMPMYSIEKSTIFDMVEDYFFGLEEQVELDVEDDEGIDYNDARIIAGIFIRKLRDTGWIMEKDGDYEEESKLAINYKIVPIIKAFQEIINPKIITYKGKLFKIYSMFENISEQESPYEGVLKEASEDFENLNQSLRTLAASIEDYINDLTQGKTSEEVLEFFGRYEEKIVVASYHRFKTNDNLFYYRTSLYESLDKCEDSIFDAIVNDYMDTENVDEMEASIRVKEIIAKIRMDIDEMENIMRIIDNRHILYRTRAVQRAQFLILSDGSTKSKINSILQYYASNIHAKENLYEEDDTICYNAFQVYSQNYFSSESLATPIKKRKSTPIELMSVIEDLDMNLVNEKNSEMLKYIKNAMTSENVNAFAREILKDKTAVSISSIFENSSEELIKIIGLYTYSKSVEREYDIRMKDYYIENNGMRFKDFVVEERKS